MIDKNNVRIIAALGIVLTLLCATVLILFVPNSEAANPNIGYSIYEPGDSWDEAPSMGISVLSENYFYTPGTDQPGGAGIYDVQKYSESAGAGVQNGAPSRPSLIWMDWNVLPHLSLDLVEAICVTQVMDGVNGHSGVNYTASTNHTMTNSDDWFPDNHLEQVPDPTVSGVGQGINLTWTGLDEYLNESWANGYPNGPDWSNVRANNVVNYSVYRSTAASGPYVRVGNSTPQDYINPIYFEDSSGPNSNIDVAGNSSANSNSKR